MHSMYSNINFVLDEAILTGENEPREKHEHSMDGDEKENMVLSENRAKSVYDFLIKSGISEDRLTFKGFGESVPIYNNSTSEGRSKNRRTECTIINK